MDLLDQGDEQGLRRHLYEHPGLVDRQVVFEGENYFQSPTLLEFAAENPIRRGVLPPNIVKLATIILDAGARRNAAALNATLGLVCSGRVARECNAQIPLSDLLCDHGADPRTAMLAALVHGEFEAVHCLLRRGAPQDIVASAAMGQLEAARAGLTVAAADDRHRALALASQFGHVRIVRLLLDAGEDPCRYNPANCHSHSTPLHQAALAGHYETVRLLASRGASLDVRDTIWHGTPADWARHGGCKEMEDYLSTLQAATNNGE